MPPPAWEPLLLDQAGTLQLSRLAAERAATGRASEIAGAKHTSARGLARFLVRVKRTGLPLLLFVFGALMTVALAVGAVAASTDADGFTRGDALRLTIMVLASVAFLGQALALGARLPGASWHSARGRSKKTPAPWRPLLLDQATAAQLARFAPETLGRTTARSLIAARGRRWSDLGSWIVLVIAVIAIVGFFAAGLAASAWFILVEDGLGLPLLFQVLFLAMSVFGLVMLAIVGLSGLADRRRRRRRRLLQRLLRYCLRLFDRGAHAVKGAGPGVERTAARLRFGAASFAAVAVFGVAFVPGLVEREGSSNGGSTAGAASVTPTATIPAGELATPVATAQPILTPTPESAGADAGPGSMEPVPGNPAAGGGAISSAGGVPPPGTAGGDNLASPPQPAGGGASGGGGLAAPPLSPTETPTATPTPPPAPAPPEPPPPEPTLPPLRIRPTDTPEDDPRSTPEPPAPTRSPCSAIVCL